MQELVGKWVGRGVASFPTIETANYREVLTLSPHDSDAILHYDQKTWWVVDGEEKILHWECGFIRQLEESNIEIINAANNGRAEVMKGTLIQREESITLEVTSTHFANDPRVKEAVRSMVFTGDQLRYEQSMLTESHNQMAGHLVAELKRE